MLICQFTNLNIFCHSQLIVAHVWRSFVKSFAGGKETEESQEREETVGRKCLLIRIWYYCTMVQTVDIFFGDVVAARHLSSWQLATGQLCGGHLGVGTWTESWPHLIHSSHMLFTLGGSHHPEGLDARHFTHTHSALSAHLIFHNPSQPEGVTGVNGNQLEPHSRLSVNTL